MQNQKLSELDDWQLQDDDQDVRGKRLVGASGETLGTIRDMIVDVEGERVSSVTLADGRAFPVEGLEIGDDCVVTHDSPPVDRTPTFYQARLVRTTSRQPL